MVLSMVGKQVAFAAFAAIVSQTFAACPSEKAPDVLKCRQWIEERWSENDSNGNPIGERGAPFPIDMPLPWLEKDNYDWFERHQSRVELAKTANPQIVFIGDSITHGWEANDRRGDAKGTFDRWFGKYATLNLGFGWDRIQNVLWRLEHGEMDGTNPKIVVIHIGTNNTAPGYKYNAAPNPPGEVADGILAVCRKVRELAPNARIVLMKVFPRGKTPADPYRGKVAAVNAELDRKLANFHDDRLTVLDMYDKFVDKDGNISLDLTIDYLHPTAKGYDLWAEALAPIVEAECGKVPSPWMPVEAKDGVVSVWGREYAFASNALPVGIKSGGLDLLAGPMRIVCADTNGNEVVWKKGGSWVQERDEESVAVCAWQEADGLAADVTLRIEFDGMAKVSLALVPGAHGDAMLEALSRAWLEIPLVSEVATLYNYSPLDWDRLGNAGCVNGSMTWPFRCSVWLGNEKVGLCWFCESDENFHPADPQKVVEVVSGEKETLLRIRLADKTVKLPSTWVFGLQATPTKPFPKDFNKSHTVHAPQMGAGILFKRPEVWWTAQRAFPDGKIEETLDEAARSGAKTIVFHEDWIPVQNNPTPRPDFKAIVDACHVRGMKVMVYQGYEFSPLDPAWGDNHAQWLRKKADGSYWSCWFREPGQRDYLVCYKSGFADLWLERAKKAYDELGLDGFYLDGTIVPWECANERHGCGWRDADGKLHATYSFFAVRRMMRSLYEFVESRGGRIDVHQSGCVCPAMLAFAHSYWDGEQLAFRKEIKKELNIDAFRAEFMGRNHGVPCEFLAYEKPGWSYDDALAITLLHDVMVRPCGFVSVPRIASVWKVFDGFGTSDAEWLPYWEKPVVVSPESVKASVYKKGGESLIVVSNVSPDLAAKAEVTLPDGATRARDELAGRDVPVSNGKVALDIDPFRMKLLRAW